jgi:hypothetical protein
MSLPPSSIGEALARIEITMRKKEGIHILHTSEITRHDREILVKTHWLEEIIQGWYLVVRPDLPSGESTSWYANFWDFIKFYLNHHYGNGYCLSAECSIDLHLGAFITPKQIVVMAKGGSGKAIDLPYGTSLLVYSDPARLPEETVTLRGIQVMPLAYALCKVAPTFFSLRPREAEIAMQSIDDPADLLRVIVEHHFKSSAARLVGAYRFLKNEQMAVSIKIGLEKVGILIQETNPFTHDYPLIGGRGFKSPYVSCIPAMWADFRPSIIELFPPTKGLPKNPKKYLNQVAELYSQDAYNSLSIEGYQVTQGLIERVKNAHWNPDTDPKDRQQRDVLAARGYYEAFIEVKNSINRVFAGDLPGEVVEEELSIWYQKLFSPSVQLGIIPPTELFGYRRHQVYIRNSRHTPPEKDHLSELMSTFIQCLKEEENSAVRAVLGHFIFVYIHPYMDGNGRLGRFLMNLMLASGGYPWTIIQVSHRDQYLSTLESASVDGDIVPFTQFLLSEMSMG